MNSGAALARGIRLLICAEYMRDVYGFLFVCGLRPGHAGKHQDIERPVEW